MERQQVVQQPTVHVFYSSVFWGDGPPEACYRICSHWPGQGLPTKIHAPAAIRPDPEGIFSSPLPRMLPARLRRRLAGMPRVAPVLEKRSLEQGLKAIRPGDLCYFWPGRGANQVIPEAKARGGRVVLEFINTHIGYAKRILDAECDRLGVPRYPYYTEAAVQADAARVAQADAIFAPGAFVAESIRDQTANPPPLLRTSYGAFLPPDRTIRREGAGTDRPLRFLFVGTVGVRKGVHILLEAWRRAKLPAELWVVGEFDRAPTDTAIWQKISGDLPDNVRLFDYVHDLASIYPQADVFVFPTLEEGDPQVTYEAAANGLPLLVSPAGGARIAQDGKNAIVVPPVDAEALAEGFVRLYESPALRQALAAQALADAEGFAWDVVADRRRKTLLDFAASAPA